MASTQSDVNATEVARRDLERHFDDVHVDDVGGTKIATISRTVVLHRADDTADEMRDTIEAVGFDVTHERVTDSDAHARITFTARRA